MSSDHDQIAEDHRFQPGAVWVAMRAGSRAANRIVQSIGRIPRYGMLGLGIGKPTDADIAPAEEALKRDGR